MPIIRRTVQNTICGSAHSCSPDDGHNDAWNMLRQKFNNKHQISCILLVSLSLHPTFMMHGHKSLKFTLTCCSLLQSVFRPRIRTRLHLKMRPLVLSKAIELSLVTLWQVRTRSMAVCLSLPSHSWLPSYRVSLVFFCVGPCMFFVLQYATKTQRTRIRCDVFHIFLPKKHTVDLCGKKFTLALRRRLNRPPRQRHQQFFQILRQMIWKFHLFIGRSPFLVVHILTVFRICSN